MVIFFNGWILYSFIILFFVISFFLKFVFKKSYTYLLFFGIMYLYIGNVINLTQFPIYIDDMQREAFGGQNVWRDMNLIPFNEFTKASFLNIMLTIPLGFGIPFLMRASFKKIFIIGILAGICFEAGQLLSALYAGYTFRFVDINDLILNLSGTVIGYFLFKAFKYVFRIFIDKFDVKLNPVLNHINES